MKKYILNLKILGLIICFIFLLSKYSKFLSKKTQKSHFRQYEQMESRVGKRQREQENQKKEEQKRKSKKKEDIDV